MKSIDDNNLPPAGFVRLPQILAVFPIGKSTWWAGVRSGRFPQPVRPSPFGERVTVWKVEDIRNFLAGSWQPGQ